MKITPFSKRTNANIYLEYVNDWLTVKAMAENYGRSEKAMLDIIDKGRVEHEENVKELNTVYIDYLNKDKNFRQDTISFETYEDAIAWAKENFEQFDPDMIKYY